MFWTISGIALLVYIIASYVLMTRMMIKSPGPYGIGYLMIPFAPLVGPLMIYYSIKNLF